MNTPTNLSSPGCYNYWSHRSCRCRQAKISSPGANCGDTGVWPPTADRRPQIVDLHSAALATVLARAVREGDLRAIDVLRVLRHELRRRNTNKKSRLAVRSTGAQEVIDRYARRGLPVPKNGSLDALHADHVFALTSDDLANYHSVGEWLSELSRLREVVCVAAAENYRLEALERAGAMGRDKYDKAGITFVDVAAGARIHTG